MTDLFGNLGVLALGLVQVVIVAGAIYWINQQLRKRFAGRVGGVYRRQMILIVVVLVAVLSIVLILPVNDTLRGQLLSLYGILVSATIALSASTFVGNVMAGMMLRSIGSVEPGNFIQVGQYFGRVTELDILHTEIQTEQRDLVTLPNLHLVTQPVQVMRDSGTILSVTLTLGYELPRKKVEDCLLAAASEAGLQEPFVQITDLGDFSVGYRVAGLLTDIRQLLATRARLRAKTLDALHAAGIEIVSPSFMNQRRVDEQVFVPAAPAPTPTHVEAKSTDAAPDSLVFDKAAQAESLASVRKRVEEMKGELQELSERRKQTADAAELAALDADGERAERRIARLEKLIEKTEQKLDEAN